MARKIKIKIDGKSYLVEVKDINANPIEMTVDGEDISVDLGNGDTAVPTKPDEAREEDAKVSDIPKAISKPSPIKDFTAPMPGTIISVAVKVGDQVVPGDEVCVLEAMKMQQALRAEWTGIVNEIHVETGQQIQGGDKILSLA